ncbi:minor tail protein [Xanthomonas phage JGB6]|nr:minor tail protein [Xanthomonas phage JGB6]
MLGDMVGSKFTRLRTFKKFLDARNFGRANLVVYSEDMTNAAWVKNGNFTPNTTVAPDGNFTADTFNIVSGNEEFYQVINVEPNAEYTFSLHARKGQAAADMRWALWDETNGAWIAESIVPDIPIRVGFWDRLQHTFTTPAGCSQVRFYGYRDPGKRAGTTIMLWGFQAELGPFMTEYNPKDEFGRNPTADPGEMFTPESWYVERKSGESAETVQFELASAFDLAGVQLPRRSIIANYCSWKSVGGYRGVNCNYSGPPVAKEDGTLTSNPNEDACGGKIRDCKLRQWPDGVLNFGGFTAAGLVRT